MELVHFIHSPLPWIWAILSDFSSKEKSKKKKNLRVEKPGKYFKQVIDVNITLMVSHVNDQMLWHDDCGVCL